MVSPKPSRTPIDPGNCSIIGAVDALGDAWSILVLRELFLGIRRFNDIQGDLGIWVAVDEEDPARVTRVAGPLAGGEMP